MPDADPSAASPCPETAALDDGPPAVAPSAPDEAPPGTADVSAGTAGAAAVPASELRQRRHGKADDAPSATLRDAEPAAELGGAGLGSSSASLGSSSSELVHSVSMLARAPDMATLTFVVPWIQENAVPILKRVGPLMDTAWPYLRTCARALKDVFDRIPTDLLPAILGLVMIFFGGHYLTTIAAVEAFRMVGWRNLRDSLRVLRLNYRKARLGLRQDRLQRMKAKELKPDQVPRAWNGGRGT